MTAPSAFALPLTLPARLATVIEAWNALKRSENPMPFADDIEVTRFGVDAADLMLIEVLEPPLRFRLAMVGEAIVARYGEAIEGSFADELAPRAPFERLAAQAERTAAGQPTFDDHRPGYARLMAPAWGDGRVALILCAVAW